MSGIPSSNASLTEHQEVSLQPFSKTAVLYLDHNSNPTPLTSLYHATASRHLTSPVPPSSITEVESAYCVQCLQFWDARTAFDSCRGVCMIMVEEKEADVSTGNSASVQRVGCASCPCCNAILRVSVQNAYHNEDSNADNLILVFTCGYCLWNSLECDLFVPLPNEDAMERCGQELQSALFQKLENQSSGTDDLVQGLIQGWDVKNRTRDKERRALEMLHPVGKTSVGTNNSNSYEVDRGRKTRTTASLIHENRWSIKIMEEKMTERKVEINKNAVNGIDCLSNSEINFQKLNRLKLDSVLASQSKTSGKNKEQNELHGLTPIQHARQSVISSANFRPPAEFNLPVPLPLRSRSIRRCRAELEAGRPGILIKPKVNPLEGDSSLRFGHGQWWKKDCSAIHIIPKVKIHKYGFIKNEEGNSMKWVLLLEIKNPTLGMVRLRLSTIAHDNDIPFPERYYDLVMDSLTLQTVDAKVRRPKLNATEPNLKSTRQTEFMTIDAVEDAFLELGRGQSCDPRIVEEWSPSSAIDNGENKEFPDNLSLVAQEKDRAWVEYIMTVDSVNDEDNEKFLTVPLRMDIEVENGSWESAWIKPLKGNEVTEDEGTDCVSFTILPVWEIEY